MGFVGIHSCLNVAARLPIYWLPSPLASVPGSCYFGSRLRHSKFDNDHQTTMRILSVWVKSAFIAMPNDTGLV